MKDLRELVLWQKHLLFVLAAAFEEKEESEQEEGFNSRLVGFDKTNRKTRTKDIHPAKMAFVRPSWRQRRGRNKTETRRNVILYIKI